VLSPQKRHLVSLVLGAGLLAVVFGT